MSARQKAEILFLEHLEWIDRVAAMTCSKAGVWGAEAEDFASFITGSEFVSDGGLLLGPALAGGRTQNQT